MPQHDYIIENAGGRSVRTDFNNALAALVGNNAGAIEPPTPYAGMLWLDLSVLPDGLLRQRNLTNTGWMALPVVPALPVQASGPEVIAGVEDTKYVTPFDYQARFKTIAVAGVQNRIINPAMQISQQNGDTAVANGGYPADQWISLFPSAAAATMQRVALLTPRKSPRRIRMAVTTAKAVLAATDTGQFYQALEGIRIGDFGFGAAGARQLIVRFGFKGPAGTYSTSLRNGGGNRSYVANFTIAAGQANVDTEQVFIIPGDVTGTWTTDNSVGSYFAVTVAAGATYQGAAGAWQAGNFLATAANSNGFATVGNTFELFDVGLYLDYNQGTPPRWQMPDEATELRLCQRYYSKSTFAQFCGGVTSGSTYFANAPLPVDMRATPTLAGVDSPTAGAFPATVGTLTNQSPRNVREGRIANATNAAGIFASIIEANARL